MEGYVYIIQSEKHGRYYIGSCTDLQRRISDHNRGNTTSTRNQGPWILVYNKKENTLIEARAEEKRIKKWKSKVMIEKLINTQLVEPRH